ncbi:Chitinase 4 [Elasticomyces elasticus]|nr:Chitinase 4 [Elasticomyces elasticus]
MVTYDTPTIAARKVEYIRQHGLGGGMWWESSGDKVGDESLINIVYQGLGGYEGRHIEHKENALDYPESKYENLRKGFPGE